ncbi:cytochrome P450 [Acaryochloris marina NIES-2412]|uniref:cytochrome P450 n=1 Tax=Acaryochloris marina TaxID=155978 RepID=UPI0040594056
MTSELLEQTQTTLPPGTFGLPLVGESLAFLSDRDFIKKHQKEYGNIFKTKLFGSPVIFVIGGEEVNFVLSNENKYFEAYPIGNTRSLLGEYSLSIQTGEVHKSHRRIIKNAFSPRKISSYQSTIQSITQEYLNKWSRLGEFKWCSELHNYTFDIACKYLISIDNGSQKEIGKLFRSWNKGLFSIAPSLPFTNSKRALDDREKLLDLVEGIIQSRSSDVENYDDALFYLMQSELDNGRKLTLEEIKHQILLLLFSGHETLTSGLSSLCLNLSQNLYVLRLCREEQEKCRVKQSERPDLSSMPYLDSVLLESIRLVPPVVAGFRRVKQTCNFNNYIFNENWLTFYQIALTHQDPGIYSQPDTFIPDRFHANNSQKLVQSSSYIPFASGMRECIGKEFAMLEMKIFASNLIANYEWKLSPKQNLEYNVIPVPTPKDGLKVKLWKNK